MDSKQQFRAEHPCPVFSEHGDLFQEWDTAMDFNQLTWTTLTHLRVLDAITICSWPSVFRGRQFNGFVKLHDET